MPIGPHSERDQEPVLEIVCEMAGRLVVIQAFADAWRNGSDGSHRVQYEVFADGPVEVIRRSDSAKNYEARIDSQGDNPRRLGADLPERNAHL